MRFLYPRIKQFPFDAACEQIVRELESRNWQVPGINVKFHEYGDGQRQFRCISDISGPNFRLWFCRVQGDMGGGWNDTAGVSQIVVPKKELHVYEDESGPTLCTYVGDDYDRDSSEFMKESKYNSRLKGRKWYLKYEGKCTCDETAGATFAALSFLTTILTGKSDDLTRMAHTHRRRRPPLLIHTNDRSREYDPEKDEPMFFDTNEVMEEFKRYLEDVVLKMIMSYPIE